MGASLIQQCRVGEEGLRIVKPFRPGTMMTVPVEEAPANFVPAAAVIRRGLALLGITGRKGRVGGLSQSGVKFLGLTWGLRLIRLGLEGRERVVEFPV